MWLSNEGECHLYALCREEEPLIPMLDRRVTQPNAAAAAVFTENGFRGEEAKHPEQRAGPFSLPAFSVVSASNLICKILHPLPAECKRCVTAEKQSGEGEECIGRERKGRAQQKGMERGRMNSNEDQRGEQEWVRGINEFHLEGSSVKWQLLSASSLADRQNKICP